MPAKQIVLDRECHEALRRGVKTLARAVKATLGPRGRNVMLEKSYGGPVVTKDGVTVAKEIDLKDPYENLGARLVREVASKTSDVAGDGTTTATVLAEAIYEEGLKNVVAGADPMSLKRGIDKAVAAAVEELRKNSVKVKGSSDIAKVGAIAANGDAEIGQMLADAMDKVGKDGVITLEEGKGLNTEVEIVEGMQFDKGYISPYFVTDPQSMECVLEDCFILVHEKKISSVNEFAPLLEKVAQAGKPLLVIAEEVEGEALALLVVNKIRGVLQVCAVKAPAFGDRRKAILEDIGILVGGQPVFEALGSKLETLELSSLGRAERVVVDKDNTTIIKGAGKASEIKGRIEQIRQEIETTTSDYDREKLQERLARLAGGVAQLKVGAATESAMKEKKARVEDALHATRAAVEEGVSPGGGVALLRCEKAVESLKLSGDEATGAGIVLRALSAPLKQIAANAGFDGSVVCGKVREGKKDFGFNAATGAYENMIEAGILDPTKVVRCALENAASVATLMLTTDALITELPKKDDSDKE